MAHSSLSWHAAAIRGKTEFFGAARRHRAWERRSVTRGPVTMKVHEYQAKELLKSAGVAVPEGIVITRAEEAARAFDALGGGLIVVKAQVHAGGRGKGVAIGPDDDRDRALEIASGRQPRPASMAKGVQLVRTAQEAQDAAASLLGKTLVTYQTGAQGQLISKVLVTVGHDIARELYL